MTFRLEEEVRFIGCRGWINSDTENTYIHPLHGRKTRINAFRECALPTQNSSNESTLSGMQLTTLQIEKKIPEVQVK